MWFRIFLLQLLIGFAISDYFDDLRTRQENVTRISCDSPKAKANNSSLTDKRLTRLAPVFSSSLKTDGKIKLVVLFDMEAAIATCGCGAKHLRFAVFKTVGNGKVAVRELDAPSSRGTVKFGASVVKGACGATVPIFARKKSGGLLTLHTTKTDTNQAPIFYAWPIANEKNTVHGKITTTTRRPKINIPATTTKKPSPAANSKLCYAEEDSLIPGALLTRLATRVPGGLKTDGKFKVIAHSHMNVAIKCGCGLQHLRYARFRGNKKVGNLQQGYYFVEHYIRSMLAKDAQAIMNNLLNLNIVLQIHREMGVFGVMKEVVCGANVPIYKQKIGNFLMLSTTKTNASQKPDFYAWP